MFVPCFDWNYLKLRSRLYRNFDCFVLLLIGDGGRDFLFSIEFDSRDGPRSVCSIVDLRSTSGKRVAQLSIDDKVVSAISKFEDDRSKDRF